MGNKNPGESHQSFDDYLQRIEKDNAQLEDYFVENPEHKDEFFELINIRNALQELQQISPSDEFYNDSPKRIIRSLADQPVTFGEYIRLIFIRKPLKIFRRFSLAQVVVTLVVLIIFATGGLLILDTTQPGDLLYGLDRALDQVKLTFITRPENVASTRLMYANERLNEATTKIEDNDLDNALIALHAYDHEMEQIAKMLASTEGMDHEQLTHLLLEALENQQATLISILEKVPEEAQTAILLAIETSMTSLSVQLDLPEEIAIMPLIDKAKNPPGQRPILPPGQIPEIPPGNRPIIPPGQSPDSYPGNRPIIPPGQWRKLFGEDSPFNPREDKPPHPRKITPTATP